MNQDNGNGDDPPTVPPKRMPSFPDAESVPAPRVAISHAPAEHVSHPDIPRNAPEWLGEILSRLDAAKVAEAERADQQHRAASRISAAFLKLEGNSELVRQEVLGLRADMRNVDRRLGELEFRIDQKLQSLESHFEKRFAAMEKRVRALEEERIKGNG